MAPAGFAHLPADAAPAGLVKWVSGDGSLVTDLADLAKSTHLQTPNDLDPLCGTPTSQNQETHNRARSLPCIINLTPQKKNATSIRIPTLPKLRLTHIGVELSNKTGEIIVLEVLGQKLLRKLRRIPHNEAV
jgi:hypothetical protein